MIRALALCAVLIPAAARAEPAEQLAALFLQSCLPYAGKPAALRQWASGLKLAQVAEPARSVFLSGATGVVFDASLPAEKLVLVSSDDGICAAITDHAADRDAMAALENALRQAGVSFRLVIERDDKADAKLHHREYLAARGGKAWRILLATVRDSAPGQAMLTAAPE